MLPHTTSHNCWQVARRHTHVPPCPPRAPHAHPVRAQEMCTRRGSAGMGHTQPLTPRWRKSARLTKVLPAAGPELGCTWSRGHGRAGWRCCSCLWPRGARATATLARPGCPCVCAACILRIVQHSGPPPFWPLPLQFLGVPGPGLILRRRACVCVSCVCACVCVCMCVSVYVRMCV